MNYLLPLAFSIAKQMKKAIISQTTMVGPTGVLNIIAAKMPVIAQITDIIVERITTRLNVRQTLIDESAGKITSAEIRSEPTRFIARTIITAVTTAIRRLYTDARIPDARAKSSSKVTANILL